MKNYLLPLLILIITISCEKNDELTTTDFEQKQIENIFELEGQSQRNAYVLLESKLKFNIWVNKLNRDKSILNKEQIEMVDQLLEIIDPKFFDNSNFTSTEYSVPIDNWMKKSKEIFNRGSYITTFTMVQPPRDSFTDEEGCGCNSSEDYCLFSDCTGKKCESSYTGCGLLWNSTCNGTCEES